MSVDDPRSLKDDTARADSPGRSEDGPGVISQADRDAMRRRAGELGRKLDGLRTTSVVRQPRSQEAAAASAQRSNALGQAFRISIDLMVGVGVGGGLGWVLDRQIPGMRPWGLVVGLLVGFAAGMMNVIRTARQMQKQAEPMQRAAPSVGGEPDET